MKKVYLDNLPKLNGYNSVKIDWKKSIGYKVYFTYNNINGWVKIIDYNKELLTIKYLDNEFSINITHFKNCQLGKLLNKHTSNFKIEIGAKFKDGKRDITITNREYRLKERINDKNNKYNENEKWYKYTCNICGWTEGWAKEGLILGKKQGCSCCHSFTVVEGINDIPTTNPEMVKFFQGGYDEAKLYTSNSNQKIHFVCPDCGRIKDKKLAISSLYTYHILPCICKDSISYPQKIMFSVLEQLNINFETEKKFEWCKYLFKGKQRQGFYDFYFELNKNKYIIETDGDFHYKDNKINGQTKKDSSFIDNEKDRLAISHKIEKPIRIDCKISNLEFIKNNILNSKLNILFDLSNINWNKAEKFALSNLVMIACKYWNNGTYSTKEIASIMKLSQATIISYLKKGSRVSWCKYDINEEIQKRITNLSKPIICLETKQIFKSISECERKSLELFGVNLSRSMISLVCNGKLKETKGYHFKYYLKELEVI